MEFSDKMFTQRLPLRSDKVKMKFCGAQLREMPAFKKCWVAVHYMRGRKPFLHSFFFLISKVQDLQNKEIAFLYKFGSKVSCAASSIVTKTVKHEGHNLLFSKPFSLK